ncbi:hypothetical protein [Paenibacillus germinis]|nr:hypothetical protein [Paenibacillus germinis]
MIARLGQNNLMIVAEHREKGMVLMGKAMTSLTKPTPYDLFMLHAVARG